MSAITVAKSRAQPSDELDRALTAFLALTLAALAPHLQRYQRSIGNYARALLEGD